MFGAGARPHAQCQPCCGHLGLRDAEAELEVVTPAGAPASSTADGVSSDIGLRLCHRSARAESGGAEAGARAGVQGTADGAGLPENAATMSGAASEGSSDEAGHPAWTRTYSTKPSAAPAVVKLAQHEEEEAEQQEQQEQEQRPADIAADVELQFAPDADEKDAKVALGWRNWSALIAYVLNLGITYVSITGVFGETNSDLSSKYQTLVTPASWAFSIWGLIFTGEATAIFALMLPRYRASLTVRVSVPWWLAVCVFQCGWTLAFAQEVIWLSVVFMLLLLASLAGMALSVDRVSMTSDEYWLLRAPFAVHLGWILCASAVNVNVMADASKAAPATLLGMAILSFAAVLLVAALFALLVWRPEPFVGLVAAWALAAINSELGHPERLRSPTRFNPHDWDAVILSALRFVALGLAVTAGALAAAAIGMRLFRARRAVSELRE
mmetsp:Transcript_77964/g.226181  ORF Transcript_77964/g.226181 Transcript_77964/m.226181 type:complete len:441 (+) Transcript_77964:85-1407(+)